MKYLIRLLALPFYLILLSIFFIRELFRNGYYFMRYGGEVIVYPEDRKTINDVYEQVKQNINDKNNTN